MRFIPSSLAALVAALLFPLLVSAQIFPPNVELARKITQLDLGTQVKAIAVDATGNVYLAGTVVGAFSATTSLGPLGASDLFVIKMNNTADQVLYATVIGGSNTDTLTALKVDSAGNAYILGSTTSSDMPFTSFAQPANPIGSFVVKLNAAGTALTYGRQMGSRMTAIDLDIDTTGAAYVVGAVASGDITPTAGVLKPTPGIGVGPDDIIGFIAKLDPSGQAFEVATYYGLSDRSVEAVSVRTNGLLILANGTLALINNSMSTQTASVPTNLKPAKLAFDSAGNIYLSGTSTTTNGFALQKYSPSNLTLLLDKTYSLRSSAVPPRIAVAPNGNIFLFGQPFEPKYFQTLNATQPCLADIAAPNGLAGLPDLNADGGLIGAHGSIPPDQAMIILDGTGEILHATFITSEVLATAVSPTNGRILTSVALTLLTQPDFSTWRGLLRIDPALIPTLKASPSCIVHGATYVPIALSPGTFMAIYGNHLGPPDFRTLLPADITPEGRIPTSLGGAAVTVDGRPAAITFSWDKQINFIVPWDTRTDGAAVQVCVTFDTVTNCVAAPTTIAAPGGFPCDVILPGVTCALNPDYSTNGSGAFGSKPAKPGESIALYMTGFGKVGGELVDGGVFNAGSHPVLGELTASTEPPPVGGCGLFACAQTATAATAVNIDYAGAAPALALGVNQVNIRIPNDMPSGLQSFTLSYTPPGETSPITAVVKLYIQ